MFGLCLSGFCESIGAPCLSVWAFVLMEMKYFTSILLGDLDFPKIGVFNKLEKRFRKISRILGLGLTVFL